MDTSGLGTGEKVAAISALLLLISMFVLGWYTIDSISAEGPGGVGALEVSGSDLDNLAEQSGDDTSGNAWEAFGFIDIICLVAILAALGVVAARATGNAVPEGAAAAVAGLGALAFVLLLFRLIVPPDLVPGGLPDGVEVDVDLTRGIGIFVGTVLAAAIAYGGYLMMNEEPAAPAAPAAGEGAAPPPPPAPAAPAAPPSETPPPSA
jgi:hypothetical protein